MSSMSTAAATAPLTQQYPQYAHPPQQLGQYQQYSHHSHSVDAVSYGGMGYPLVSAATAGGSSVSLPHKRGGASSGLPAGGTLSPVRARPLLSAPLAPAAPHSAPLTNTRAAATAASTRHSGGNCFAIGDMTSGTPGMQMASELYGSTVGSGPGPSVMRQLFPPPPGCGGQNTGTAGSGGTGKPTAAAAPAVSAPLGPRPAMSGKSSASATHSVSAAHTAPVRGAAAAAAAAAAQQQHYATQQQQQLHKGCGVMGMGSYRIGQQGSMAAEVEDDGEEVHGPPQRSSTNRPMGVHSATVSSNVCGPAMASAYYGGAPTGPPPYDYPPGYYYPPAMGSYSMRMYGMPPPSAPPGYRPPLSSGVPMYGMPPPSMPYGNMSGGVPAPWPEYSAPLMGIQGASMGPQPGHGMQLPPGSSGGMSGMQMRGGPAGAGSGAGMDYMQAAGCR